MRLDEIGESGNIEDRRGEGGGGFGGGLPGGRGGLGVGAIALLTLVGWATGINPAILIGGAELVQGSRPAVTQSSSAPPPRSSPQEEQLRQFVSKVLKTSEDIWQDLLPKERGISYQPPRLVLFRGSTRSGCGGASSAMGPFYCPADRRVYLDMSFFDEMRTKLGAGGDFAYAYVIAHEVGHHIENELGILGKVQAAQRNISRKEANALSVRVELMADCLAGVWAHHANQRWRVLEPGDVDEALTAAAAIGDDKLQKQAQGYVVPDSFTHGTSAQRARWLNAGLKAGKIAACDTFNTRNL